MTRHFQLKVTSPTTNIDVDSVDGAEVARIAQLAGIVPSTPPQMGHELSAAPPISPTAGHGQGFSMPPDLPELTSSSEDDPAVGMDTEEPMNDQDRLDMMEDQTCSVCGASDHSEHDCPHANMVHDDGMTEGFADYDHGHHRTSRNGEEVDPDSYLWQAKRAKQHFGKDADNTMDDPVTEAVNRLYHSLTKSYREFIAEDRENDAGLLSPLSNPDIEDFDKDPLSDEPVVDDGSRSPLSTVERQPARK
jgi:hypothetical protein